MSTSACGPSLSSTSKSAKSKGKQLAVSFNLSNPPIKDPHDHDHREHGMRVEGDDVSMQAEEEPRLSLVADLAQGQEEDDSVMIDSEAVGDSNQLTGTPLNAGGAAGSTSGNQNATSTFLEFPALKDHRAEKISTQTAKVTIPPHRMTPLKRSWPAIYTPLVDELGLLVRVNAARRRVELKTSKHTKLVGALSKATSFLDAFAVGFSAEDALALVRLDDIYIETFEVKDVKTLTGDHLSRAIGRIAGKDGRTRFAIENTSRTRIVLADSKIHILGTFSSIKIARDAVCALILGSPPGKVYHGLRTVAARQKERF